MNSDESTLPTGARILRWPDLKARGVVESRTTLWRMVRSGAFPRPVALTKRSRGWLESEVDGWIAQRAAERV